MYRFPTTWQCFVTWEGVQVWRDNSIILPDGGVKTMRYGHDLMRLVVGGPPSGRNTLKG